MGSIGKRTMNDVEQNGTSPRAQRHGLRRRLGLTRSPRSEELRTDNNSTNDAVHSPSSVDETPESPSNLTSTTKRVEYTLSPSDSKRFTPTSSSSSGPSFIGTESSTLTTARKGVKYSHDGTIVCCRFCEILRSGDADFVYEDDDIAVFRPLAPVVDSHVLVVPRCHIRNINMLTTDHISLLKRMKKIAEIVLGRDAKTKSGPAIECKFAFHKPPFNSIDHVHMHAFRKNDGSFGCVGSIKYRTETWWCRSFDEVLSRVDSSQASSTVDQCSDLSVSTMSGSLVSSQ